MLSIIIPTYNEEENIAKLVSFLLSNNSKSAMEIIISDGGSTDNTMQRARDAGATAIVSPKKGRAAQMNAGAALAKGDLLYFVHADTFPPASFVADIDHAIANGYELGRYRTKFDSKRAILKFNAFFTRFDLFISYGGDQTLFITNDLFKSIGGFDDSMLIMEDYEIITRAKQKARYKIIQKAALISARKYETNGWLRVQTANYKIIRMYKNGAAQMDMVNAYKKRLRYR